MSSGSITESYPAFSRIGLRGNPGKNLNQVTCPDRVSNPYHLFSRPDALTVTPQPKRGGSFIYYLYLSHSPKYLLRKVALIFGIFGAFRRDELYKLTVDDVEDIGSAFIVKIPHSEKYVARSFMISGDLDCIYFLGIFRNYSVLRISIKKRKQFVNVRCHSQLKTHIVFCIQTSSILCFCSRVFRKGRFKKYVVPKGTPPTTGPTMGFAPSVRTLLQLFHSIAEGWIEQKNSLRHQDSNPGFQLYVLTLYPLSHTEFQFRCKMNVTLSSIFQFSLLWPTLIYCVTEYVKWHNVQCTVTEVHSLRVTKWPGSDGMSAVLNH
ncbi:hypothetical protein ANN_23681 [Periplaneta americana]|uniref:Uncharacterized protein n=1 Tax=Periplaneta americana TaxID=6978 RepID=A0ABQ8SMU8_PERAM|nr:hypothetical protein ANN_23681 [Periplaneta americana]